MFHSYFWGGAREETRPAVAAGDGGWAVGGGGWWGGGRPALTREGEGPAPAPALPPVAPTSAGGSNRLELEFAPLQLHEPLRLFREETGGRG